MAKAVAPRLSCSMISPAPRAAPAQVARYDGCGVVFAVLTLDKPRRGRDVHETHYRSPQ